MNTTGVPIPIWELNPALYAPWEKALLGITPVFLYMVAHVMYKRVRRPLEGADSVAKRLNIFYNLTAGIIWGQFFFHLLPNATTHGVFGYKLRSIFFLIGYGLMFGYERFSRIAHDNIHYVAPASTSIDSDLSMDRERQEEADYVRMDGNSGGEGQWYITDEMKDLKKRRFIAIVYYLIMVFHCMAGGLFLALNENDVPHVVLAFIFFIDKTLESIALYTVLIHAKMYAKKGFFRLLFLFIFYSWPLVVLASVALILADVTPDGASLWVNHIALGIFYGIAAGIFLWFSNHFQHMELKKPTRRQIIWSFIMFILMAFISWITGYFI